VFTTFVRILKIFSVILLTMTQTFVFLMLTLFFTFLNASSVLAGITEQSSQAIFTSSVYLAVVCQARPEEALSAK
jgi:hypothetical protein